MAEDGRNGELVLPSGELSALGEQAPEPDGEVNWPDDQPLGKDPVDLVLHNNRHDDCCANEPSGGWHCDGYRYGSLECMQLEVLDSWRPPYTRKLARHFEVLYQSAFCRVDSSDEVLPPALEGSEN